MILARFAALLLLLPLSAACGDDGGGTGGGGTTECPSSADPGVLELADVSPAPGTTVANDAVVHSFRIVGAPGNFDSLTFELPAEHTAGTPTPGQLSFTITQEGEDLVYTAAPLTWAVTPSHVEMRVPAVFESAEGCAYTFPSPVFSYDVEAANGGGGGGQGGAGGGA